MKKLLIAFFAISAVACNEQTSCPETVLIDTPYGKVEVVKGELTDSYLETARRTEEAERNLDKPIENTPSRGY